MYGIVIVAYNPDIEEFNPKIQKFTQDENAMIVIVNNGTKLPEIESKNIIYRNLGENKGIAYAQNVGIDVLIKQNIKLAFLLDQDSTLSQEYFKKMVNKWHEIKNTDSQLAVLAPNVFDVKSRQLLSTRILDNSGNLKIKTQIKGNIYNTLPISSGILLDTHVFKEVGGNRADYFIDWVDFQFDLDVIKAGYHVYTTADIKINHQIGNSMKRKFLGKTIHPTNHSIFRNYYFFRNGILFLHENKSFKFVKRFVITSLLKRYISIFYENDSKSKHKANHKGIKDAKKIIKKDSYNT
ncbi:hypothetical protein ACWCL1_00865 [Ligilactobacillus sp. LYQ135]